LLLPSVHSPDPEQVLGYLARYTDRVALPILLSNDHVSFRWKDFAKTASTKL
jgi:hypothetical protein